MDTSFNGAYPNFLMQHCRLWGGGNRPVIKIDQLVFGSDNVLARINIEMARRRILFLGVDFDSDQQRLFASRVIAQIAGRKEVICLDRRSVFDVRQRYPGELYSVDLNVCNDMPFFGEAIGRYAEGTDAIGMFDLRRTSMGRQWIWNIKGPARLNQVFDSLISVL